jgi:hypothetical protein
MFHCNTFGKLVWWFIFTHVLFMLYIFCALLCFLNIHVCWDNWIHDQLCPCLYCTKNKCKCGRLSNLELFGWPLLSYFITNFSCYLSAYNSSLKYKIASIIPIAFSIIPVVVHFILASLDSISTNSSFIYVLVKCLPSWKCCLGAFSLRRHLEMVISKWTSFVVNSMMV